MSLVLDINWNAIKTDLLIISLFLLGMIIWIGLSYYTAKCGIALNWYEKDEFEAVIAFCAGAYLLIFFLSIAMLFYIFQSWIIIR